VSMLISNKEHHYIMGLIISRSKLSSSYQKITCSRLYHSLDSKLLIYYSMITYAHNVFNQVCGFCEDILTLLHWVVLNVFLQLWLSFNFW